MNKYFFNKKTRTPAIAFALGISAIASATTFNDEKNISLEFANTLATAVVKSCSDAGYHVAVTVVDRGGNIKAVQRMDHAGPHTISASQMKAFTSLSTKTPSIKVMEAAQANAGANNVVNIDGFLLLGGGLPIQIDNQTIGAVGVGGAPGGHLDHQCAESALTSMIAQLK